MIRLRANLNQEAMPMPLKRIRSNILVIKNYNSSCQQLIL